MSSRSSNVARAASIAACVTNPLVWLSKPAGASVGPDCPDTVYEKDPR